MNNKTFFETNPVFRYDEFVQFKKSQGVELPSSCKQQLSYHHKAGHLIHIRKFLYAVKLRSDDRWVDPYLIAGKATEDSIIAYHSALELHGVAYTTFTELQFLTVRVSQPFSYDEHRFRAIGFSKALLEQNKTNYLVDLLERNRVKIALTSLERTIVDVLGRPDLGGGWEEIWRSFDNVTQLNLQNLIDYTLLLGNATLVSKVGFFLEQRPAHFRGDESLIETLIPHIPKQPHYMSRAQKGPGKLIEKWRLIVPVEIINRRWEEPSAENI